MTETGRSRPGTGSSTQRPRSRVMPSLRPSSEAAAVPPHSSTAAGSASAMSRHTKGRQSAVSSSVGLRLPGGRQNRMLLMKALRLRS